jgi:hypothetical protein
VACTVCLPVCFSVWSKGRVVGQLGEVRRVITFKAADMNTVFLGIASNPSRISFAFQAFLNFGVYLNSRFEELNNNFSLNLG